MAAAASVFYAAATDGSVLHAAATAASVFYAAATAASVLRGSSSDSSAALVISLAGTLRVSVETVDLNLTRS